jgi:hypothetical protein
LGNKGMTEGKGSTIRRWLVGVSLIWPFLVGYSLLSLYPDYPKNKRQWLLVIILGPPANVLGEALFGWIFSREHGYRISKSSFSVFRILFAIAVFIALFAIGFAFTLKVWK